jgi:hypothetical protein
MADTEARARITEDWLRSVGFKWHQFDRQPNKQWLLWLGSALLRRDMFTGSEDLGIELAENSGSFSDWFCWLRSDSAHRYHRFIHIRHLRYQDELIQMIEGLTGQQWNPANNLYGSMCSPESAERQRQESDRLDMRIQAKQHPWHESEKDPDRGRPLVDHVDAAIKSGLAK